MILSKVHSTIYGSEMTTEVRRVINLAKSNSFHIPESKISALNKFIKKLKYAGIWDRTDDFWVGAYNDANALNFSRISLKKAVLATPGTALQYNIRGWKGTGSGSNSDFNTQFLYTSSGNKLMIGDSNTTALVSDVSDVSVIADSLISSAQANASEIWSAWNTNLQRQLSSDNLSANADLSGIGFKSFSKIGTNCTLYNKNIQINRTQSNNSVLPAQSLVLLRNSTTRYSKLGLSMFSIGGNLVGLEMTYRDIINEYLTEIGLTAFA